MSPVEFLANRAELPLLELADRQAAPAVSGADQGGVHELQHRPLAERMRDDFRAPALLEEEPLEEIGGANHLAMAQREAQMGDAGLEVIDETPRHRGQVAAMAYIFDVTVNGQRVRKQYASKQEAEDELDKFRDETKHPKPVVVVAPPVPTLGEAFEKFLALKTHKKTAH